MEAFGVAGFNSMGTVTKKRSNIPRRPRPESQPVFASREISSILASDKVDKISSDENTGHYSGFHRKELNVNNSMVFNRNEGETHPRKSRKDDSTFGDLGGFYSTGTSRGNSLDHRRSSEGVLAPANWKTSSKVNFDSQSRNSDIVSGRSVDSRNPGISPNGSGGRADASSHENKLRKVKLKVGGVTRTIHAKSTLDNSLSGGSSKPSRTSDTHRPRQKLILQENSDDEPSPPNRTNGVQGIPMKDFGPSRHTDRSSEPVRKSKRVPKRRVLDGAFDEEEDEELRYLGRLKTAKVSADYRTEYGDDGEEDSKRRKCLKLSKSRSGDGEHDDGVEDYGSSRRSKEGKKKLRSERESEDTDYAEDEDNYPGSDGGPESKRKRPRKESLDSLGDGKKEVALTTRQRALLSGKCAPSGSADNLIEFPNGLPPAPPRKQKEKLSEVEQQLKKAEAAQRRRMQVEKANKESQEEAIRKILGQDSNRKKKEDKQRKQRDEMARGKAATAATLASSTVRWVMGPTGTVVMFPKDFGLPSIFDSKPCSYPPPREKCAGPSCTNTYKYRDSKSKLPLCSLQCYRAIQGTTQPVTTC